MAYKNRAIDHFIDKCLKSSVCTMQDIVRIGHMSDGYDHLQEIRLNMKIKTTMSKTSWSKHVQKLQSLNIRYKWLHSVCISVYGRQATVADLV